MTGRLTDRDRERVETLSQVAALDVTRHLLRSGADQLESAAAWAALAEVAVERAERHGGLAVDEGVSYAEVARALRISRQSARERYRHLRAVG